MSKNVFVTIKKELKRILRDKKSLLMMIITPLTIPLFIVGYSYLFQEIENKGEDSKYVVGVNYNLNDTENEIIKKLEFETKYYDNKEELDKAYDSEEIRAYIYLENELYTLYFNGMNIESSYASKLALNYLESYNTLLGQNYLNSIGADLNSVYSNIKYTTGSLAGDNSLVNEIVVMGLVFAVMAISLTAIYSATDATAGEKERGTLETILTFPLKSSELLSGKFLAIFISCFITSLVSLLLLVLSLIFSLNTFDIFESMSIQIGVSNTLLALVILTSYSLFISGLTIVISSFAKTYKEAQSLLTPISMVTIIPMFMDLMDIGFNHYMALIPVVNHTLLIEQIFYGKYDILDIVIMFISTIIYSIILIKLISILYRKEEILFND